MPAPAYASPGYVGLRCATPVRVIDATRTARSIFSSFSASRGGACSLSTRDSTAASRRPTIQAGRAGCLDAQAPAAEASPLRCGRCRSREPDTLASAQRRLRRLPASSAAAVSGADRVPMTGDVPTVCPIRPACELPRTGTRPGHPFAPPTARRCSALPVRKLALMPATAPPSPVWQASVLSASIRRRIHVSPGAFSN